MDNKLFRNSIPVISDQGIEIDEGSLWELIEGNYLVLVDEDQYITSKLTDKFYEI